MIIISSRKNFVDADHLAIENKVRSIDLVSNQLLDNDIDLNKILLDKKVLVLVHGYNNKQNEIYNAYKTIEDNVLKYSNEEYDHIIGQSWPGGDKASEWWSAKAKVEGAAILFFDLLKKLSHVCASLDVMSHSLGAAVTLHALLGGNAQKMVRNYFCTAPAVDNESLEPGEEYHDALKCCEKIFVFHSSKDGVLRLLYKVAEQDRALGVYGPDDSNFVLTTDKGLFVANCKRVVDEHGGYKNSLPVYQYMQSSISGDPEKFVTLH